MGKFEEKGICWTEVDEHTYALQEMPFQDILRTVVNTLSLALVISGSSGSGSGTMSAHTQSAIDTQTARAVSLPPSPVGERDLEIGFKMCDAPLHFAIQTSFERR